MTEHDETQVVISCYKNLFSGDAGSIVLDNLKAFACYSQSPYVPGCFDATAYRLGKREVIEHIIRLMNSEDQPRQKEAK